MALFSDAANLYHNISDIYESIFLISMIIEFITDFDDPSYVIHGHHIRDLGAIAKRYIKSGPFVQDLIPLLPL